MNQQRLFRPLWLSIAAAVATILLKTTAWLLTGSVGLLSDAAESVALSSHERYRSSAASDQVSERIGPR